MVFGRNTNLKLGDFTFHIQTEDRGESHALIDTVVYYRGRVLYRRANNYFDLLPLDEDRQQALKLRLDEQHRILIEEMRSGALQIKIPSTTSATPAEAPVERKAEALASSREPKVFSLDLMNAKSWLSGKRAKLFISVRQQSGEPVIGALVKVEIEGSDSPVPFLGRTDNLGQTHIEFDMPRITSPEAALVILAEDRTGKGHLRFALRAKPRVA
jgi:hypothetical protein